MSDHHRDAIADELAAHMTYRDFTAGCNLQCGYDGHKRDTHLADVLLASEVLAQIRAEARAEAWRDAANALGIEGVDLG